VDAIIAPPDDRSYRGPPWAVPDRSGGPRGYKDQDPAPGHLGVAGGEFSRPEPRGAPAAIAWTNTTRVRGGDEPEPRYSRCTVRVGPARSAGRPLRLRRTTIRARATTTPHTWPSFLRCGGRARREGCTGSTLTGRPTGWSLATGLPERVTVRRSAAATRPTASRPWLRSSRMLPTDALTPALHDG
jgi:hypothetical protein